MKMPSSRSFVAVIVLGLAFNIGFAVLDRAGWGIDFNQFYSSGRLAGAGHLYDWEALRKIEVENGTGVPTGRLPVVAYGYKLLAWLPYPVAHWIWLAVSLAALGVFAMAWPGVPRQWMIAALVWSVPATLLLLYGQDTPFWLMFFAAGLLLLRKEKPWLAGVAFALCICKFHLALGIPILLASQKRWKALIAGAGTFALLIAACFLIEGPDWVRHYLENSRLPSFSPAPERMPTLYGLSAWLPWTAALEMTSALAVVLFLWWFCRRTSDLGMAGAAAAACGLLLAHHAYASDCVLLLPLLLLTIQHAEAPAWLKLWAALLLAPAPVALLASPLPLPGQILVAGFVAAGLMGFLRVRSPVLTVTSQSVTLGMGTEGGKDRELQNADSSAG
jgi:glycosyl transferase family 87